MDNNNKEDLRKAVHSKIKGLGLDALFHQVDKSTKDEFSYAAREKLQSKEEIQLMNRLKNPPRFPEPKNIFSKTVLNLYNLFNKNDDENLIIDIGTSAVKIIEAKQDKSSLVIEKISFIQVPHIVTTGEEKFNDFVITSLKDYRGKNLLKSKKISTLIPRSKVIMKFFSIPTIESSEIKKMLEFEAEHHLPLALSDVEYDFLTLDQENNKSLILFAAAKKQDISKILSLFEQAGITLDCIGVSSLALYNGLFEESAEDTCLQVLIGSEYTDINITRSGSIEFSRGIELGSKKLTMKISENLNIDFENAEKIKKENGILLKEKDKNDTQKKTSSICCSWADGLINEIEKSIQHFQLHNANQQIKQIVLTGGGSKLENLNEYLRDKLKTKTVVSKKPQGLRLDCDSLAFDKYYLQLQALIGLALSHTHHKYLAINLLPQSIKKSIKRKKEKANLYIKTSLAVLLASLLFLIPFGLYLSREKKIKGLQAEIIKLKPQAETARQLQTKISTIEDYISTKQSSMDIMREISLLVTDDIIIDRFSFEQNRMVSLIGTAKTHSSAVNFSQSLSGSSFFESSNLKYSQKKDRYSEIVDFEIICILKNKKDEKPEFK
ncbi:MAG: type IV pilus assembly protein PilM [Candidatus Omnitrophica bacterium]|nr:type IV pilus assembly protein PilM [Candidatus Omnitrophota bacterium]